ncbi:hypothetical protein OQJ02_12690 [Legionella sp. PATHC032]|nr:hypothetical protein [Legionella sp. PATHC032]MCW8422488.1 hypothetical protein [Legionella sp. PATHC032]
MILIISCFIEIEQGVVIIKSMKIIPVDNELIPVIGDEKNS